ncbi:LpxL/LpxP family acyltransferase [Frateuria aurantia]
MSAVWQSRPEAGGYLSQRIFLAIAKGCGRRFALAVLWLTSPWFVWSRRPEREASRQYLQRVLGRPPTLWQLLKHHYYFSIGILDRVYLLSDGERHFSFEVEGVQHLAEALRAGHGALLFGAHLGSFEALRTLSRQYPEVPLHIVLDKQQTPVLTELMASLAPALAERIIDASAGGPSVALAMAEQCARGGMVAILADRGRQGESLHPAPFLGTPAGFPVGPWLLAASLKVPVVLCFGLYLGGNRYRLVFEPVADRVEIPRGEREAALDMFIRHYAGRLEHFARAAPYNWFNLYDFWDVSSLSGSVADSGSADRHHP